jgi:quercetin dioxygenase-like cupin family protein
MLLIGFGLVAAACGSDDEVAFDVVPVGSATIVDETDIEFAEISPFATFGSAQGDFTSGPHGTFGIFGAGASSPPHTHSSSYYAVVLSGDMTNPFGTEADPPTLTPGSFWAVPADDEHVTRCVTTQNECRFFFHAAAAFDFTPIDEIVEARTAAASATPIQDLSFEALDPYDGSAPVWGDPEAGPYGAMIRLDVRQDTGELAHRNAITLVPVLGQLTIYTDDETRAIDAGSVLEAEANTPHTLSCDHADNCLFYLFSD